MNYNEIGQWVRDLGGGYSQIRPLDEGGMGTIYRAHKDSLDVEVVIKRVKQKFKGRMDERAEANILKTLKHKYLPRIYDVIESPDGYVYTIMDLIEGVNLQKYVAEHGPVGQRLAYRWACQLCEVIAYLHAQVPPILHCDIKPSNIMITPSGDICLIDFNTSLVYSKGVLAIGATPGYAAPEQYSRPTETVQMAFGQETVAMDETMPMYGYPEGAAHLAGEARSSMNYSVTAAQATGAGEYGTVSKRTDVYGIGATLYYTLTGKQPNHSLKDVKPITSYKLRLSRSFVSVIDRAMKKQQSDRFCDAQEMLRALQNIHAIDKRYKAVVNAQRVVATAAVVTAVIGVGLIAAGVQRIGVERYAAYDSYVRQGRTAGEELRFEDAEKALQSAIAIYDDQLEAYVEQAVLLYRQGKYQECIDAVGSAQNRSMKYYSVQSVANLYNVCAESHYALGEYENAVRMYQKAIEYVPTVAAYYQGMATAQVQMGDVTGAQATLAQMQAAIPQAQQGAAYQIVQGEIARKRGDLQTALQAAKSAITAGEDSDELARAYRLAADVCEDMGDDALSQEIELLNEGIEKLPASYYNSLAGQLAAAYARQAELEDSEQSRAKALETYRNLYENGNSTLEVRLNIAMLQYQLHKFGDAMTTLQALQADYPKDYRVYKWMAFVQGELDVQKGALQHSEALSYASMAEQLYREAQADGVYDSQMDELDRMVQNNWK